MLNLVFQLSGKCLASIVAMQRSCKAKMKVRFLREAPVKERILTIRMNENNIVDLFEVLNEKEYLLGSFYLIEGDEIDVYLKKEGK